MVGEVTLALLVSTLISAPATPVATPFPLADIRVTGGRFAHATDLTAKYLLDLDPERLLAGFRANAGLAPKGEIYGGWETGGLSGHSLGHYLTACAQEYARTGDKRFKDKVNAIVQGLAECQAARGDGFLCAFRFDRPGPNGEPAGFDPERLDAIWAEVAAGNLRSGGFDLNGMWSPWYVHHKVFAGLLDAHALCNNSDALPVAAKFGKWAVDITKNLTPEQWQTMLGTEYGGMNESLAELYARTKEPRYLALARKFYDNRVLEPLARGEDNLAGKHSNTQIPKLVGLGRLYELTGNAQDRQTAEFFWQRVAGHHSYAIGGNSNGEYLGPPDQLAERLSFNTAETCNTYNMLRLTRQVFSWNPQAAQMDFYERAYLNHILASQHPETGMVTYFMPLAMNSHRGYSDPEHNFTCCHGTGMENHTKHGDSTYFHQGAERLWVNLFLPTELNWREAGVRLAQETNLPEDSRVTLRILEGEREFELLLRHPEWAKSVVTVRVNGEVAANSTNPSSYISLRRKWRKGDRVEFDLPMTLHTEPMPDNPKRVALMYGPLVLAADMGRPETAQEGASVFRTPVIVNDPARMAEWLKPVAGQPLTWRTEGAMQPQEFTFSPFYALFESRYGVYFDIFTPEEWAAKEAEYRAEEARLKDIQDRTVDAMNIGEMQPERDHNLTQERNDVREQNNRGTRQPLAGGWVEFDMAVPATGACELLITYWGNDRIRPDFVILVDSKVLARETLEGRPMNVFFDVAYAIPVELTQGKSRVRVRIEPASGKVGPSLAGARVLRVKAS